MNTQHAQRYIDAFERLSPTTLQALEDCFSDRARFVDPFNDVRGKPAIRAVFAHMFASCEEPRFTVDECLGDENLVYLHWRFRFGTPSARRSVQGVSRVQFATDGRVTEHRDYWDPCSQVYEKVPVLGRLFRALRRRLAAPLNQKPESNSPSPAKT